MKPFPWSLGHALYCHCDVMRGLTSGRGRTSYRTTWSSSGVLAAGPEVGALTRSGVSATGGSTNDHFAPEKAQQAQRVAQRRSEPPVFETRDIRLVDPRL
jgi:hypothetical protein